MAQPGTLAVHPSNAEQARAWDGTEGDFWTEHAVTFDEAVAAYHGRFMAATGIRPGDRVLDIGCGAGQTTRDAARLAGPGSALGVDLSGRLVELARALAEREGVRNAAFEQADVQVHPFAPESFDVAVSRTGAMFFGDPVAAFGRIAAALRPGGRLVLLVWQPASRNEWFGEIVGALCAGRPLPAPPPQAPGPFSLGDPDRVRDVLTRAGFAEPVLEGLTGPMLFGRDPAQAYELALGVLGWLLDGLDADGRGRALRDLRASVEAHHTDGAVAYRSATWLVTATRR